MFNHYYTPNAPFPDCHRMTTALMAARSNHTGGVQTTLCDGSVRFVGNSVDAAVWRGLATRNGGEVVTDF